jgi:hypothetical protein
MPSPETILAGLKLAANDSIPIAIVWHVAAAAALLALAAGWRPSRRLATVLLSTPIASASIIAFAHGNPFNGSLLGALTIALTTTAIRLGRDPVRREAGTLALLGVAMIGFGLFYPHFLERSPAMYLVAAPTGLIPCPTLSLVIGFTLLAGGFASRAWSLALALLGLFYGFFGMFRLGVVLDLCLVVGAVVLLVAAVRKGARVSRNADTEWTPHFTKD